MGPGRTACRQERIATRKRGCSQARARTRSALRSGKHARQQRPRCGHRTTSGTGGFSLLHLRGVPWARIAEFVGQRDLTVTANTYTHVLVEAEVTTRSCCREQRAG